MTHRLRLESQAVPEAPTQLFESTNPVTGLVTAQPAIGTVWPTGQPEALPFVNETCAVAGTGRSPSVTSVAPYVTVSVNVSVAVKVSWPFMSVVAGDGALICDRPAPWKSTTVFPATPSPCASWRVTVIVDAATPSALTSIGFAPMPPALAGGVTNGTVGCAGRTRPSVVSVAVT